jgi:hypothetical protein
MGFSLNDLKDEQGLFKGDSGMGSQVVDLIREFTGKEINCNSTTSNDGIMFNSFSLANKNDHPLTIPEKSAVAAFSWYCREYAAGLKRKAKITFPKIIHSHSDETAMIDSHYMTFTREERAYMFAEVVEHCFKVNAKVIDTPAGWAVTVSYSDWHSSQTDGNGFSAEMLAMLQGACRVLCSYPVGAMDDVAAETEAGRAMTVSSLNRQEAPEARQAWHDRHNAPLERIESMLGEILSRLERPDEKGVGNTDTLAREKRLAKPADAAQKSGKTAASRHSA